MLVIFCGQDLATSRTRYSEYKTKKQSDGYEILTIPNTEIVAQLPELHDSIGLFSDKKIITLEEVLKDKKNRDFLKDYQDSSLEIVIYESVLTDKELKFVYPSATFITSKLPESVFTLLDSMYPGNLRATLMQLSSVTNSDNELLIFYMIKNRARELLLLKKELLHNPKLQVWQLGRLKSQATKWNEDKLTSYYDNLYKIEKNFKTSQSVFSITQALEMLFCFYL